MLRQSRDQDQALRDTGLKSFIDALHSDRMVAITGSMTTENLGYPGWNDLITAIAQIACDLATELIGILDHSPLAPKAMLGDVKEVAERIKVGIPKLNDPSSKHTYEPDRRVRIWKLYEAFGAIDRELVILGLAPKVRDELREKSQSVALSKSDEHTVLREFERRIAAIFMVRTRKKGSPPPSIVTKLINTLGIRRIATLNYDFELERELMLLPTEGETLRDRDSLKASPKHKVFATNHEHLDTTFPDLFGPPGSGHPIELLEDGRLSRILPDGTKVISDVVDRERPDQLFEFAVSSARIQRHILHLHGRADIPKGMVAHIRQYDALYRRDDLNREPFDHALLTLIEGNPILFLGLGMSEPEINEKLQYLVGNTPRREASPLFVIWNRTEKLADYIKPYGDWDQYKKDMRSDFFERLGVHVIFGDDLDIDGVESPTDDAEKLDKFNGLLDSLGKIKALGERIDLGDAMQMAELRAEKDFATVQPCRIWGVKGWPRDLSEIDHELEIRPSSAQNHESGITPVPGIVAVIGNKGVGRGLKAERLMRGLEARFGFSDVPESNRLLINGGFAYDSDTALSAIARFLFDKIEGEVRPCLPLDSENEPKIGAAREDLFRWLGNEKEARFKPSLIVINGADRFFGKNGAPISAAFDFWLREICQRKTSSGLKVVLLGSHRIDAYCEQMGIARQRLERPQGMKPFGSLYPNWVSQNYAGDADKRDLRYLPENSQVALAQAHAFDPVTVGWKFFEAHLEPNLLASKLGEEANYQIAIEVLRAMCFIGAPIEGAVLQYVPRVRVALAGQSGSLAVTLNRLIELGLILRLNNHHADQPTDAENETTDPIRSQLALHTALASYLRDRHGAPLNDSKLANAFNLSVFMSDSNDTNVPDQAIHDELAELVDHLCGAWHDISHVYPNFEHFLTAQTTGSLKIKPSSWQKIYIHKSSASNLDSDTLKRAFRDSAACLRAAAAIVRSYYSTGALLKFQQAASNVEGRQSGALRDHARRIDRLLASFNKITMARSILEKIDVANFSALQLGQNADTDAYKGRAPLYAEEVVWLLNERAVVAIAQGDLPAAARALSKASDENRMHVEAGRLGRNWRRLTINRVSVRIERGRLHDATELLDQLETEIDSDPWQAANDPAPVQGKGQRVAEIRRKLERMHARFGDNDQPFRGDRDVSREESFILALVSGYRGLVAHMRGDFVRAESDYRIATQMLQVLGEKRASAHFQRHHARLLILLRRSEDAKKLVERAADDASAARQWDLWHRCMIVLANLKLNDAKTQEEQKEATDLIRNARDYAVATDCYRVRIEANASIARRMRYSGNFGTALRHIADALGIACRYRHSLMMTSLRIELGKILEARGDPVSGEAMIGQAVAIANAKGHNVGIERVSPNRARQPPQYF